ncbi:MAG: hypothetical protein RL111_2478 [Pseudomonadota bacterium]
MNRSPTDFHAGYTPVGGTVRAVPLFHGLAPHDLITGPFQLDQIEVLVQACLRDQATARQCVVGWMRQGMNLADIYLHGITAAARLVGRSWAEDCLDFGAVTIVSARLHRLLYDFSPQFQTDAQPHHGGTVLIFPEPGAQHTMGSFMLTEFFRREGWYVTAAQPLRVQDALGLVSGNWIDLVALSVSSDRHLVTLADWVTQMRQASTNPDLKIMVGGPMACVDPQCLSPMQADVLGKDALHALDWAKTHVLSQLALTQ